MLQVLEAALEEYKQRHEDENTDPDETILSAGDYLLRVLEPVQQQRTMRNYILLGAAGACSVVTAGVLIRRLWSRDSSSGKGSSSSGNGGSSCSVEVLATTATNGTAGRRSQHKPQQLLNGQQQQLQDCSRGSNSSSSSSSKRRRRREVSCPFQGAFNREQACRANCI